MIKVQRYFLDIREEENKTKILNIPKGVEINLEKNKNFELNKFFYKQVGFEHYWRDRLIWSDKEWKNYISRSNFQTWILKKNNDLDGFYEQEFHSTTNEVELINLGILKEFRNMKLGSFLLSHAIQSGFKFRPKRIWVHTCSLDHKNALDNYKSRGFKIYKKEEIDFVA